MKRYTALGCMVSICIMIALSACKKELPENPYDKYKGNQSDTLNEIKLDTNSFEGIYQAIFKPNCANSGCHDGTFEPDFRSISSAYNQLVYHSIIKNDTLDPYLYRAEPGNTAKSMIIKRLTVNLYGNSGIMPLVVEPSSDWPAKKEAYINRIKKWISDGCPDIFGRTASGIDQFPQLNGFQVQVGGSNQGRKTNGVVKVPLSASTADILLAISDNEKAAASLGYLKLALSKQRDNFSSALILDLSVIPPQSMPGYDGLTTPYSFKTTIANPAATFTAGEELFLKVMVDDGVNGISDLPGMHAMDHIKNYYSIEFY